MRRCAFWWATALLLASPAFADVAPCYGKDGGVRNSDYSAEELAYIGKRYLLVCQTRNPEDGLRELNLFTAPDLKSRVENAPMVIQVDMAADRLVEADGEQFIGGHVFSQSRCPLVQFFVPDANGGGMHHDYWYMLSTDLTCELKRPGED